MNISPHSGGEPNAYNGSRGVRPFSPHGGVFFAKCCMVCFDHFRRFVRKWEFQSGKENCRSTGKQKKRGFPLFFADWLGSIVVSQHCKSGSSSFCPPSFVPQLFPKRKPAGTKPSAGFLFYRGKDLPQSAAGSETQKLLPASGVLSTVISPPQRARMRLTSASPRPLPAEAWEGSPW